MFSTALANTVVNLAEVQEVYKEGLSLKIKYKNGIETNWTYKDIDRLNSDFKSLAQDLEDYAERDVSGIIDRDVLKTLANASVQLGIGLLYADTPEGKARNHQLRMLGKDILEQLEKGEGDDNEE